MEEEDGRVDRGETMGIKILGDMMMAEEGAWWLGEKWREEVKNRRF